MTFKQITALKTVFMASDEPLLRAASADEEKLINYLAGFGPTPLNELSVRIGMNADVLLREIGKLYASGKLQIDGASPFKVCLMDEAAAHDSSHIVLKLTNKGLRDVLSATPLPRHP